MSDIGGNVLGAAALTSFGVWQIYDAYTKTAPKLTDLRESGNETTERQQLLDTDMMVGGVAVLAGATASWLSKNVMPLLIILVSFVWLSWYHHLVLKGPTPDVL